MVSTPGEARGVPGTGEHDRDRSGEEQLSASRCATGRIGRVPEEAEPGQGAGVSEPCTVAMEACGGGHRWGREIGRLGQAVRLVRRPCVKACIKRQKNEAADAAARQALATLANRMARIVWALMMKKESCRAPAAA